MSDDQRIIDAINTVVDDYSTGDTKAPGILAALREAGFEMYRPEDCKAVDVVADPEPGIDSYGEPYQREPFIESGVIEPGSRCLLNPGAYRLVPAESADV